ncbi:MAG: DUF4147 domain-containing protein [Chthonomonadales bacterium]|nr:DUF4147 domain-containing protein [Chthonomonadales bacterium]
MSGIGEGTGAAREAALTVYRAALEAVRADRLVRVAMAREGDRLRIAGEEISLAEREHLYLIGAGKAAVAMAEAVEGVLGDRLAEGVVVTRHGYGRPLRCSRVIEAGHPAPDEGSLRGGEAVLALARRAGERDLVVCVLSGGASALLEAPREGITLADLRETTSLMLKAGAPIEDLNAVRACLSHVKAGGLARATRPARTICLVLSDVLGNPLDVIGSGPCLDVPVSPARAREAIRRHGLEGRLPPAIGTALARAEREDAPTSPPAVVRHVIVGDIWTAIDAAGVAATALGLRPCVLTGWLRGEAREVGRVFGAIARDLPRTAAAGGPGCYLAGGETTVTVRGDGVGGRSQELALAAAREMRATAGCVVLAAGTDGADGPTDAAGAVVDGATAGTGADAALARSDSYPFLQRAGALIRTGPTDSNVGDLVIVTGG